MTIRRIFALLLFTAATAGQAQVAPWDFEAGYRWLNLKGSPGMYRTQVNEREGFLIRSFNLATTGPNMDRLVVHVSDFGTSPAGSLRLEACKQDLYRFTLGYRSADQYSIFFGQHYYNRARRTLDADLELFPESRIAPYVGYSFNRFAGPGETTYHFGQDEFLLQQKQKDIDQEVRVGASFKYDWVYGSFTQGWRRAHSTIDSSLFPGAGNGNNNDPILGQPVNATSITRHDTEKTKTPFTNLYVTLQPLSRGRVIANYVHLSADSDGNESEAAYGSFASFAISRFFTGATETATSHAKNTTWRSGVRGEYTIAEGVDAFAGYQKDHRDLNGSALIDTLYLQSITFGGVDQRDFRDILASENSIEREETTTSAGVSVRNLGNLAVRAEFRQAKVEADVAPDLSEIVVPGNQEGSFERRINTLDTNAQYATHGWLLGAAWRSDSANQPIFRTDYKDRDRYRLRAQWSQFKWAKITSVYERTTMSNDTSFESRVRNYTTDAAIMPTEGITLHASVSSFKSDSTISYRRPQTFVVTTSVHSENGHTREGGIGFALPHSIYFDANIARLHNDGTYPFKLNRYNGRMTFPLKSHYGLAVEYNKDRYVESSSLDYDATRWGLFLRIQ